jgi:hypothetical protein
MQQLELIIKTLGMPTEEGLSLPPSPLTLALSLTSSSLLHYYPANHFSRPPPPPPPIRICMPVAHWVYDSIIPRNPINLSPFTRPLFTHPSIAEMSFIENDYLKQQMRNLPPMRPKPLNQQFPKASAGAPPHTHTPPFISYLPNQLHRLSPR